MLIVNIFPKMVILSLFLTNVSSILFNFFVTSIVKKLLSLILLWNHPDVELKTYVLKENNLILMISNKIERSVGLKFLTLKINWPFPDQIFLLFIYDPPQNKFSHKRFERDDRDKY